MPHIQMDTVLFVFFAIALIFLIALLAHSADAGDGEAADELHVISGHLMFYQYDW